MGAPRPPCLTDVYQMKKRKKRMRRISHLRRQVLLRKSHCSDGIKGTGRYKTGFIFRL